MEYLLCDNPWDDDEIKAINSVICSNMYTMSKNVFEYEKRFAEKF